MLRESLARGHRTPLLAAPCSFGKTITAAYILKSALEKGKRGIFICDRVKLVQQSLDAFGSHDLPLGVMQGFHEMTDHRQPIQIASVQTLARRANVEFDIAIVDECHVHYETVTKYMKAYSNVPFIGLSATPYSKGLGVHYDDLILPITPRGLLDKGYLCPVYYYGGKRPDLSGVRRKRIRTGGTDYDPDSLGNVYETDKALAGDIIYNWMQHGENSQTIAFCPSIRHSKHLVDKFNLAGIPAVHIDGYMDDEERQIIYEAHDRGEYKILSCSRLLNTGYDAPQVRCLIDCYPTDSLISYVQRAGRIMRTHGTKEHAIYLDHAGNCQKHGFAEDIIPEMLDDGTQRFSEKKLTREKKEPKVKECPQCTRQFIGVKCECGYEIPVKEQLKTDDQVLQKMDNNNYSIERKSEWLGELYLYAQQKGYTEGWANHKYKAKFNDWPNKIRPTMANAVSNEVQKFIQHQNIKYAKGKQKYDNRKYLGEAV